MLEAGLPKKRILELYLNIIEWGPGMFGIEATAKRHFHKPASQLRREEAAHLASVSPGPLRRRSTYDTRYEKKSQLILKPMLTC